MRKMSNPDELEGLELIAAFARVLGYGAEITDWLEHESVAVYKKPNTKAYADFCGYWTELPADLIIQEFNRLKPTVFCPTGNEVFVRMRDGGNGAFGPDLQTAVARLRVKLEKAK